MDRSRVVESFVEFCRRVGGSPRVREVGKKLVAVCTFRRSRDIDVAMSSHAERIEIKVWTERWERWGFEGVPRCSFLCDRADVQGMLTLHGGDVSLRGRARSIAIAVGEKEIDVFIPKPREELLKAWCSI